MKKKIIIAPISDGVLKAIYSLQSKTLKTRN